MTRPEPQVHCTAELSPGIGALSLVTVALPLVAQLHVKTQATVLQNLLSSPQRWRLTLQV